MLSVITAPAVTALLTLCKTWLITKSVTYFSLLFEYFGIVGIQKGSSLMVDKKTCIYGFVIGILLTKGHIFHPILTCFLQNYIRCLTSTVYECFLVIDQIQHFHLPRFRSNIIYPNTAGILEHHTLQLKIADQNAHFCKRVK